MDFSFPGFIMFIGWLEGRPMLDMFTIGVRYVLVHLWCTPTHEIPKDFETCNDFSHCNSLYFILHPSLLFKLYLQQKLLCLCS